MCMIVFGLCLNQMHFINQKINNQTMEIIVVKDLCSVDWVMPAYNIDSNGEITSGRKRFFDSLS